MKSVEKSHLKVRGKSHLLNLQEEIISKNASQWLLGFHDPSKVLISEYSFANLLEIHGGSLNEGLARFYLGEFVLAIHAVHSIGFAHRNLSPETILLDSNGHLKLSGFQKSSKITSEGLVSSPLNVESASSASYEAPEILRTLGNTTFTYGIECDFWSLGVIAYEAVSGSNPFKSSCPLSAFKKITAKKSKGSVKLPPNFSQELQDFIHGLLVEKEERMNYEDCIMHPFFNSLIWDGLRNEVAPFIPPSQLELPETRLEPPELNNSNTSTVLEPPTMKDDQFPLWDSSVDSIVQSRLAKTFNIPLPVQREDDKLKSELQIKTTQLMEKLHEIQILQTQLHKITETLESKEKQLAISLKENKRFEAELSEMNTNLQKEKKAKDLLKSRLDEIQLNNCPTTPKNNKNKSFSGISSDNANDVDVFELNQKILKLTEDCAKKDEKILELSVQLKILRHDLRLQELQNQCLVRREEAKEDIFTDAYTSNVSEMEQRIIELEQQVQKTCEIKANSYSNGEVSDDDLDHLSQREVKMKEFINSISLELSELQEKLEEDRVSRELSVEESRKIRKQYSEAIGQMQGALDKAVKEYEQMMKGKSQK